MALSIKHDEADRLARDLARLTGESLTEAVLNSLRERLSRKQAEVGHRHMVHDLLEIGRRCSSLPVLDELSEEEILGYDDSGLPTQGATDGD